MLHRKLNLSKKGSKYTYGKNDLFSVVIAFRYLLSKEDFLTFKKELLRIFKQHAKSNVNLEKDELLEYRGFPPNWERITRFHKI